MQRVQRLTVGEAAPLFPSCQNAILAHPSFSSYFTDPSKQVLAVYPDSTERPMLMEWVQGDLLEGDHSAAGFWCPLTDGDTPHYQNLLCAAARNYPDVFEVVAEGFPYAVPDTDVDSVLRYAKNSTQRTTQTIGKKYHDVMHTVNDFDVLADEIDELKRSRYSDFLSRRSVEFFAHDVAEHWYVLSGHLADGTLLHHCVMAANEGRSQLIVPIFAGNPNAPRTYYAYAIAHFACLEHARNRGIPKANFMTMFDYKVGLGFPITWMPSVRLTRPFMEKHGLLAG